MLNDEAVRSWDFGKIVQSYTQRDTMLYALGIGMGGDPLNEGELQFVFEKALQAVPTMATVLGSPGFWWRDARTGADWVKLVHGEQDLRIFRPLPSAATVVAVNRVVSITDKGEGKGAIAVIEREIVDLAIRGVHRQGAQCHFPAGRRRLQQGRSRSQRSGARPSAFCARPTGRHRDFIVHVGASGAPLSFER